MAGRNKRELTDWRAAQLRFTAFPAAGVGLESRNFWNELQLGESHSHERKRGEVIDQGPALGHWLVVTSTAIRVDWLYVPQPEASDDLGFRDVGSFPNAVGKFASFLRESVVPNCPVLQRVALGATVHLPVENRVDGYRQLSAYLPFELDAEKASDFSYQINRPRTSNAVSGLAINRLTKWSVAVRTDMSGHIVLSSGSMSPFFQSHGTQHVCQLILDVNSAPDLTRQLGVSENSALLDEFVKLALELVAHGDTP